MLGIILFTLIATNDPAPSCVDDLIDLSTSTSYNVRVNENPLLFISAHVIDSILYFAIRTKGTDESRHPRFKGADQFSKMLKHLYGKFNKIEGNWYRHRVNLQTFNGSLPSEAGDNLAAFNQAIRKGLSPIEAAKSTWTGQQAIKHGYTEVKIVTLAGIEGSVGNYYDVKVLFSKPK